MSWKASIFRIFVALCFGCVQEIYAGDHGDPNTCSYIGVCTKVKTIHGRTISKTYLCKKREPCETTWGPWSPCKRIHGTGYRRRVGRCVGTMCDKLVKQVEECDPNPPPTPPATTAPPPPPTTTAPPPPPTTTAPPPRPTTTPEPDINGNWSPWSSWVTTQCSVSCCGGTQSRTRTRTCDNPPPSGNGTPCPGPPSETEDGIMCNEEECPLSCAMVSVGTIFNDPCVVCSNEFRACGGPDEPIPTNCPPDQNWSPIDQRCQLGCDPV